MSIQIIISLFIIGTIMFVFIHNHNQPYNLSPQDFKAQVSSLEENEVLLDVRTPVEYKAEAIKNAKLIDFTNPNFRKEIKKLNPSKKYYLYCRSGNRSHSALKIMQKNGFENVQHLQGGIIAWKRKNYPTTAE